MRNRFLCAIKDRQGQSLVEIMIGLTIGAVLIGAASLAIGFFLRSAATTEGAQTASQFARQLISETKSFSDANWQNIYALQKSTSTPYFLNATGTGVFSVFGKEGLLDNDVPDSLAGFWKFDEDVSFATSVTYDASGNGNDGMLFGSAMRASSTCRIANCLAFDGATNYVTVPDAPGLDITQAITIAGWVNPNSGNAYPNRILDKGDGGTLWEYALLMADANDAEFSVTAGGILTELKATNNSLPQNTWTHVAGVYDGTTMYLYMNGSLVTSTLKSGLLGASASRLTLGARSIDGLQKFSGSVDDLRLYSRALSASEIARLYRSAVYTRSFSVENVCRSNDSSSTITGVTPCGGGSINDPSTQKITVFVNWLAKGNPTQMTLSQYVTRWKNRVFRQSDWSGGAAQKGPLTNPDSTYASGTNIDASSTPGSFTIQGF